MTTPPVPAVKSALRVWLPVLLGLLILSAAVWVLHRELQAIHYQQLRAAVVSLSGVQIVAALALTAANFLVLSICDQLAFTYIRIRMDRWRICLVSMISYALSNSVGFALLSGTSVRHRFYSRWGVETADLSRLVLFIATIPWLGLLSVGGFSLLVNPQAYQSAGNLFTGSSRWLGLVLMLPVLGYFALSVLRRRPIRIHGFRFRIPSSPLMLGQWLVSVLDWTLAAMVLYTLLPMGGPGFAVVLGAFIAAQILGLVSHVPGGLGVFEGMMVLLLGDALPVDQLLAALVLYRLVYYVVPLTLAMAVLLADELRARQVLVRRVGQSLTSVSVQFTPRILAVMTFLAGALLLVSGATPAVHERLHWMAGWLPVGLFEASHFMGSLVGVGLLVLAQAIARRIRLAYVSVVIALVAGILMSLLKAGDWEEAALLTALLLALVPSRACFDRQAALFDTRFSPGWVLSILATMGGSIWLGFFVYRHVDYSNDLWWQVALNKDASRFLRASVGAAVLLAGFGAWRLLRPRAQVAIAPSEAELAAAGRVIALQSETLPYLAYLGDKALLFNATASAFVMYGIQGRTWAALGDPVGPTPDAPGLIRSFIERADDYGGLPVFYQVRPTNLHYYADLGLTFAKLGEEARLPLAEFSLEGRQFRDLRSVMNRMERDGTCFRVVDATAVPALMPQLMTVSDDWLDHKSVSEKGFSVGYFDEDYLLRLPVAVLEQGNRVIAFANLLPGADGEELSVDLMRFTHDAPNGTMDGLFTHLIFWGKAQGYAWFNLGMAPLSGIELSPLPNAWSRVGRLVYGHGEVFYNFEGLRAYKEKFRPVWEPRYLAYPGGLSLPLVLADIAALSAGGYLRIFR